MKPHILWIIVSSFLSIGVTCIFLLLKLSLGTGERYFLYTAVFLSFIIIIVAGVSFWFSSIKKVIHRRYYVLHLVFIGVLLMVGIFRLAYNPPKINFLRSSETTKIEDKSWKTAESNGFLVSYPPDWKFEFIDRNNGPEFDDMSEVKVSNSQIGSVSFFNFALHGLLGENFIDTNVVFGGYPIRVSERIVSENDWWDMSGSVQLSPTKAPIFFAHLNEKGRVPTSEERKIILKIVSEVKIK